MNKIKLKDWILAAEFAAFIAIFAQLTIPLASIPITGQTFAVGMTATILPKKTAFYAVGIYLLMGLVGLPVFAGGKSGVGVLFGPTGGFLLGFLAAALLISFWLEKFGYVTLHSLLANFLGAAVTLFIGTFWLWLGLKINFSAALTAGALPFILPTLINASASAYLGLLVRRALLKAHLLKNER
ncbi:biotin transporter BioY [Enterococcus timonensis]|uniref:biotin transporter BioY n=1 Tax=Enterococcus timonensis TaxID=1852364 RepID=UPI0008DB3189|nr:biotin transporter BioY [Enterococcus timonensis]